MDYQYAQRAKYFQQDDQGKWIDKGTGHVSMEFVQRSESVGLVFITEDANETSIFHRVVADDIYRRQDDTIISWTDPEHDTDLALSFQDTTGCSLIWDQICNVRRNLHYPIGALDIGPRSANEASENSGTSQGHDDGYSEGVSSDVLELPSVELATLPQIVKIVGDASPVTGRDRVASLIVRDLSFLRKLTELFRICEDLENMEGLHMIYKIVKGIVSLNDGRIFNTIFSDEFIIDIIGCLEYDPDLHSKQDHRSYLREHVIFKEAVPIREPGILSKIHQTYRIGYIKDVILSRVLDEQRLSTINSMIVANNIAVVSALQGDAVFIKDLFARLRSPTISEQNKKDLIYFLQEFCSLSKSLQLTVRVNLFSTLDKEGLLEIVTDMLQSSDENIRLIGTDILTIILVLPYPNGLHKFLSSQSNNTLLGLLVTGMLTPNQGGLQIQLLEIIRMLLDCETMEQQQSEKNSFLDVFYTKYMDQIMEALTSACPSKDALCDQGTRGFGQEFKAIPKSEITAEILGNICEILCVCVQHHTFKMKYYAMGKNVIEKVLRLTGRREKFLVVAAVRFFRTCIGKKDEIYYRYILKHDLFEPIMHVFLANGNRYNLLNSAVLELFDFIRFENIKVLIVHIIDKFYEKLKTITYVDVFQQLKIKYDQAVEGPNVSAWESVDGGKEPNNRLNELSAIPDHRRRRDDRALDREEEEYFNEDSDDEVEATEPTCTSVSSGHPAQAVIRNGSAMGPSSFGLVDYEDEDEDSPSVSGSNGNESPQRDVSGMISPGNADTFGVGAVDGGVTLKRKSSSPEGAEKDLSEILKRQRAYDEGNIDEKETEEEGDARVVTSIENADTIVALTDCSLDTEDRDGLDTRLVDTKISVEMPKVTNGISLCVSTNKEKGGEGKISISERRRGSPSGTYSIR